MIHTRVALTALLMFCVSVAWAEKKVVKYSYTGPTFTYFSGEKSPWTEETRLTGYFLHEELPPSTTVDFLDPDLEFPFPNLPKRFAFTEGSRTITDANMEPVMKNTRIRNRPLQHEVRVFAVTTDAKGDVVAWDILFVSHVLENTYLTVYNGYEHGMDESQVEGGHFGCVDEVKCVGIVNYTSSGPKFRDTVYPGSWKKEYVDASELTAQTAAD